MIASVVGNFGPVRRACALVVVTALTVVYGCGTSTPTSSSNPADAALVGKTPEDVLKPEQMYRYEGTGAAKKKVELSRKELRNLMREEVNKPK